VFELVSRTVKYVGTESKLSVKIKEIAVDYINSKCNNWIESQNGGWVSNSLVEVLNSFKIQFFLQMSIPELKTDSYKNIVGNVQLY
jgi:hypothetical protein